MGEAGDDLFRVASGLIDELGGLNDALSALHHMIEEKKQKSMK